MTDMPAAAAVAAEEDFRIGMVYSRAFGILRRNTLVFVPLAAMAALPNLLQNSAVPLDRPLGRTAATDAGMQLPMLGAGIVESVILAVLPSPTGSLTAAVGAALWEALFTAYAAILGVVTYHDLRVVKEGVDIERIAAVFD